MSTVRVVCSNPECGASFLVSGKEASHRRQCSQCGRPLATPAMSDPTRDDAPFGKGLPIGSLFADRYSILRLLGKGGMGSVYLAKDHFLGRTIALKVPHFNRERDASAIKRFKREAKVAAGFEHPNLCRIIDVGEFNGTHYLTMPHLQGTPLDELIKEGQFEQASAISIVHAIAEGLAEAHRQRIVHRDLNPSNVLMQHNQVPVVLDFGLAKHDDPEDSFKTTPGTLMGTTRYMAPEQVRGDAGATGPQTDVYALGVILYELLTGNRPFQGSSGELFAQILQDEPTLPSKLRPSIDPRLDRICQKAMAKVPGHRFDSMTDFAKSLEPLRDSSVGRLDTKTGRQPFTKTSKELGGVVFTSAVAVLIYVLVILNLFNISERTFLSTSYSASNLLLSFATGLCVISTTMLALIVTRAARAASEGDQKGGLSREDPHKKSAEPVKGFSDDGSYFSGEVVENPRSVRNVGSGGHHQTRTNHESELNSLGPPRDIEDTASVLDSLPGTTESYATLEPLPPGNGNLTGIGSTDRDNQHSGEEVDSTELRNVPDHSSTRRYVKENQEQPGSLEVIAADQGAYEDLDSSPGGAAKVRNSVVTSPDDEQIDEARRLGEAWRVVYHAARLLQANQGNPKAIESLMTIDDTRLVYRIEESGEERLNPFTRYMDSSILIQFIREARLVEREEGEVVCRLDDGGDTMFLILRGGINIYPPNYRGVIKRGPGRIVGELAFALKRKRTAEMRAAGRTALLAFSYERIRQIIDHGHHGPEFATTIDRFLKSQVLKYMCDTASYFQGRDSPFGDIPDPWKLMGNLARVINLNHDDHHSVSYELFEERLGVRDGVLILGGGDAKDEILPEESVLNERDLPILYANFPNRLVRTHPRYRIDRPMTVVHIPRNAFTELDRLRPGVSSKLIRRFRAAIADQYRYDVFLSHIREDREAAVRWYTALTARGYRVYLDQQHAPSTFIPRIAAALLDSLILVPLLTENTSRRSRLVDNWVYREIEFRKQSFHSQSWLIVPVNLGGGPIQDLAGGVIPVEAVGRPEAEAIDQLVGIIKGVRTDLENKGPYAESPADPSLLTKLGQ